MKSCRTCKVSKPLSDFHRDIEKADGHRYICKACAHVYIVKYYKNNKQSINLSCKRWNAENKERRATTGKKWSQANRAKTRDALKKWKLANREKHLAKCRAYAKAHREQAKAWKKNNPHKVNASTRLRQVRELQATPKWANQFFMEEAYDLAARRSRLKTGGIAKWHVDHIVPLRSKLVCGLHVEHNLQVIPASMNVAKSNKYWPDMAEN